MEFKHPSYYKRLKKQQAASVKPEFLNAENSSRFVDQATSAKPQARRKDSQASSRKPQAPSNKP